MLDFYFLKLVSYDFVIKKVFYKIKNVIYSFLWNQKRGVC